MVVQSSLAAIDVLEESSVSAILIDSELYGGCMAKVSPGPETILSSCNSGYVSFSCDGTFNSRAEGEKMLAGAQLAYVSGKPLLLVVDDSKRHNSYCVARRVDNVTATP